MGKVDVDKYDAITFDFCGTLDADGVPWWKRMFNLIKYQPQIPLNEVEYHDFYKMVDNQIQKMLSGKQISFKECVEEHLRTQAASLGFTFQKSVNELANEFVQEATKYIQHHLPTLIALHEKQLSLIIITNGYGSLEMWCKPLGLSAVIDSVIDSGVIGVRKPDKRIFNLAVERLGVNRNRILHIGDNLRTDIYGANQAGLQSAWIRRQGELPPADRDKQPNYILGCVNEVMM